MNVSRRSVGLGYGNESNVYTDGDGSDSNEDLRWVLYLTMIFGAIEVIIIYGKYDFLNVFFLVIMCSWLFWRVCCQSICSTTSIRCISGSLWLCWVSAKSLMYCGSLCMPAKPGIHQPWVTTPQGKSGTFALSSFSRYAWLCLKCLWGTFCLSTETPVRIRNTPLMCWVCWRLCWVPISQTPLRGVLITVWSE